MFLDARANAWIWAAFVFLGNLVALIAYLLAHHPRPKNGSLLLAAAACGKSFDASGSCVFAYLICNAAGGFAGGLAGSLAFAAAAICF